MNDVFVIGMLAMVMEVFKEHKGGSLSGTSLLTQNKASSVTGEPAQQEAGMLSQDCEPTEVTRRVQMHTMSRTSRDDLNHSESVLASEVSIHKLDSKAEDTQCAESDGEVGEAH